MSKYKVDLVATKEGEWVVPPVTLSNISDFKHSDLLLFTALCLRANDSGIIDATHTELARDIGVDKTTVSASIARLVETGRVTVLEFTSHPRIRVSEVIRWQVYKRDRYRCVYCGADTGPFEVDHAIPVSRGGKNNLGNLVTACIKCNRNKKDMTADEFRQQLNASATRRQPR